MAKKRSFVVSLVVILALTTVITVKANETKVDPNLPCDTIIVVTDTTISADTNSKNDGSEGSPSTSYIDDTKQYSSHGGTATMTLGNESILLFENPEDKTAYENSAQYDPNVQTGLISDWPGAESPLDGMATNTNFASSLDTIVDNIIEGGVESIDMNNPATSWFITNAAKQLGIDGTPEAVYEYIAKNGTIGLDWETQPGAAIVDTETGEIYVVNEEFKEKFPDIFQDMLDDDWGIYGALRAMKSCNGGQANSGRCEHSTEGEVEENLSPCEGPECEEEEDDDNDNDDDGDNDNDDDGDNDDDDGDDDYDVVLEDSYTCEAPDVPAPVTPKGRAPRVGSSTGADCLTNPTATSTSYSYSKIACGLVTVETTVTTTVNYPQSPSKYPLLAGSTFNWGSFSSSMTSSSSIYDTSALNAKIANLNAQISALEGHITCLEKANELNHEAIEKLRAQKRDCTRWRTKYCEDDEGKQYACGSESYEDQTCVSNNEKIDSNIAEIDGVIKQNEEKINNIRKAIINYQKQLDEVNTCAAEVGSYSSASFSQKDVVKFSGATLELDNGYVQNANTIVAIAKNSGNLLTEKISGVSIDLPGGILKDVEHYAQFTIPVTTKNGTKGRVYITNSNASMSTSGIKYRETAAYPAKQVYEDSSSSSNFDWKSTWLKMISTSEKRKTWYEKFYNQFSGSSNPYTNNNSSSLAIFYGCSNFETCYDLFERKYSGNYSEFYNLYEDEIKETFGNTSIDVQSFIDDLSSLKGDVLSEQYMHAPSTYTANVETLYECPLEITNAYICTDEDCPPGELNLIYRTIELSNPFPDTGSTTSRKLGQNWSVEIAYDKITMNRSVKENEVYKLQPLYTITLTPSTIKEIREYNNSIVDDKKVEYSDFNLVCDEDGNYCTSAFLRETLTSMGALNTEDSCAITLNNADNWYDCHKGVSS